MITIFQYGRAYIERVTPRVVFAWALAVGVLAAAIPVAAQTGESSYKAEVFAPETISTGNVYRGSFTPDGNEFYFFKNVTDGREDYRIFVSYRVDGDWSEPKQLDLGGEFSDLYPAISPDGRWLIFSSYRPAPGESTEHPSAYLWAAQRAGDGWSEPKFMAAASQYGHYHAQSIFDKHGSLYFIRSTHNYRDSREYVTRWEGEELSPPKENPAREYWSERLPEEYMLWETTPGYDDSYILLVVARRDEAGRPGPADFWIAFRTNEGWSDARPLGAEISSPEGSENFGFYSGDGTKFFFVRDFNQFYHVPIEALLRLR